MAYATPQEFIDKYPIEALELTTRDNVGATEPNQARLQAALNFISSEIDGYLGERYTLPIAVTAALAFLKTLCLRMTAYELDHIAPQADVRQRYDDAIAKLKAIEHGDSDLPGGSSGGSNIPEASTVERVWDDASLSDYGVQA